MPGARDYEAVEGETAAAGGIRAAKEPRHFAGCEPQNIPASSEVTFVFALNMDMNPEQLIIPDAIKGSVAVVGASIGPISINAGDGPFPGDGFGADSTARFLPATPVTQGQPLRVRVRNMTTTTILGAYLGVVGRVKRSQ